jgi:protein-tyrosine phosphatase
MKILMVCLGNICRSPMAEGIMNTLIQQQKPDWEVRSAGTESYHIGAPPHKLAQKICQKNHIDISHQRARRLERADFLRFDKIYAMAGDVLSEIRYNAGSAFDETKAVLFLDELYPGENRSVPDPWYGEEADYESVFQLLETTCKAIMEKYGSQNNYASF